MILESLQQAYNFQLSQKPMTFLFFTLFSEKKQRFQRKSPRMPIQSAQASAKGVICFGFIVHTNVDKPLLVSIFSMQAKQL